MVGEEQMKFENSVTKKENMVAKGLSGNKIRELSLIRETQGRDSSLS